MAATAITVSSATLYYGTDAEINALSATLGDVGFATDTGKEYTNTDGGTTWAVTRAYTSGAAHVSQNGAVTAVTGTLKAHPVTLADANPATATAGLITGTFKAVWFEPTILAIATAEVVLVGFSTAASDATALGGLLTAVDGSITTPNGVATENILVYTLHQTEVMKAVWDGTTTIKTVMARISGGATSVDGIVWTVE